MAGVAIASRCIVVIRGGSNPPIVEVIYKAEEASGVPVLIPTCAKVLIDSYKVASSISRCFVVV